MRRALFAILAAAAGMLAGCGPGGSASQHGWVLHSRVGFFAEDLKSARDPLPRGDFRLFFPYIAGDLYGPATTGDFIRPTLNTDLTFEIDFTRAQQDLNRSLQPTEFSLDYLKIDPADARIARLAPLALQPDGIEQVAMTDWIDAATHERLMLVYVDRPARITGTLVRDDYTIRYNVRAPAAGYIWIARRQTEDGEQMYTEVEMPEKVILALTPPPSAPTLAPPPTSDPRPSVPQRAVSPAHTDIPAP